MSLEAWQRLMRDEHAGLRDLAMQADPGDVAAVARLRRHADAELVRLALELARARRKAEAKFPGRGRELVADVAGVEMASSQMSSAYKAERIARCVGRGTSVVDLCCGIGGDAMGLTDAGLSATCVDIDPARAWMAGTNARCASVATACDDERLPGGVCMIDPARRDDADAGGRRTWSLKDLRPGLDVVTKIVSQRAGACVKLGPGVDVGELPSELRAGHLEILSEQGRLTQALVWTGVLMDRRATERSATLLRPGAAAVSLIGIAVAPVSVAPRVRAMVFEPDDSVERAGLLGELCVRSGLEMVHERVGLLTGEVLPTDPIARAMLTAFQVVEHMPWNERRVREVLIRHRAGVVEVKTRGGLGKVGEADELQRRLRGAGNVPMVVFVRRLGERVVGIVARRVAG